MAGSSVKLIPERDGYLLGGERVEGFPDQADLPERQRVKIARWATQLRPDEVTVDQRALLERQPQPPSPRRRAARQRSDMLSSPLVRALWSTLDEQQQSLVLNPDRRVGDGARFPLTVGKLAALVQADRQKIRRWGDNHLLPSTRDHNGHRQYGAAAAIVAFALEGSKQNDREFYGDVVRSDDPLAAVRRAVGLVTFSAFASGARVVADDLERTSRSLRLVADALTEAARRTAELVDRDAPDNEVVQRVSGPAVALHDIGAIVRLSVPADDTVVA